MDLFQTIISSVLGLVATGTSFLIGKIILTDKVLSAHVASDTAIFERFLANFADVKNEQRDQTLKLDRLIEQNMTLRADATLARGTLETAAASALAVVEHAKAASLQIIASAAADAKAKIT